jgi:hypothetical protein
MKSSDSLKSVQPQWCLCLPLQQQAVLLLGARGPDGISKYHPCKPIQRAYRAAVFLAAKYGRTLEWGEREEGFMCLEQFSDDDGWAAQVQTFFDSIDSLPHHFTMHLLHGAQILGYKHPDERFRNRWREFYILGCRDLHMTPETEAEMDIRLSDWGRAYW